MYTHAVRVLVADDACGNDVITMMRWWELYYNEESFCNNGDRCFSPFGKNHFWLKQLCRCGAVTSHRDGFVSRFHCEPRCYAVTTTQVWCPFGSQQRLIICQSDSPATGNARWYTLWALRKTGSGRRRRAAEKAGRADLSTRRVQENICQVCRELGGFAGQVCFKAAKPSTSYALRTARGVASFGGWWRAREYWAHLHSVWQLPG